MAKKLGDVEVPKVNLGEAHKRIQEHIKTLEYPGLESSQKTEDLRDRNILDFAGKLQNTTQRSRLRFAERDPSKVKGEDRF